MAKIKNFEDIQSWQKARELTSKLYSVSSTGPFAMDW